MNVHVMYGICMDNEILSETNENSSRNECEEEQQNIKEIFAILIKPAKHALKHREIEETITVMKDGSLHAL